MKIEDAIYTRSVGYAALAALVATRVYPGSVPEKVEFPAISYNVIDSQPQVTHSGPNGWTRGMIQFVITSDDYDQKKAVAQALRDCWHGFRETITGPTGSIRIGYAFVDEQADIDEALVESNLGESVNVRLLYG
jgi:hypothetical protein